VRHCEQSLLRQEEITNEIVELACGVEMNAASG